MMTLSILACVAVVLLASPARASSRFAGPEQMPGPSDIVFFVDPVDAEERKDGPCVYGLTVKTPWKDGGSLFLNFPEHLQHGPNGNVILHHHDPVPIAWSISPDGLTATYSIESPSIPGVLVEAFARVASADECPAGSRGAYLALRITNDSEISLPTIRPLICAQYRRATGFPQWTDNFKHTYISMDGNLAALADLPTEDPETSRKGCVVKGCPQRDTRVERMGGLIEQDMDLAATVVTSLDDERKIVFWWTPGMSMISNARIPCIHADPYFGTIGPGESGFAEGMVLFTDEDAQSVVDELRRRDRTQFQTAEDAEYSEKDTRAWDKA